MEKILKKLEAKSEELSNGCIEWRGGFFADGYGQVHWNHKKHRVHRLSYELFVGAIPEGHVVRHQCDNPKCMNPEHLIVGTVAENNNDCRQRGRNARGEGHPQSKLTNQQVLEIFNSTDSNIQLAKKYGVTEMTTGRIKCGKLWVHITQRWGENNRSKE